MQKHPMLVLIAAGIISVAAPLAIAQSNPSDSQQGPPPSQDNGMHRRGGMDPAQRTQELTQKLKLTSDQQSKVQSIYESAKSQMESLRSSSTSQDDRRSKMMEIHKNADAQVREVLDSNQQKKFDEMQARHEQRMQNGGPGAGQNPQPPQ